MAGDDPALGQVPALHLLVPQPGVARVDQVEGGPLLVPYLPPRVPRVGQDRRHRPQCPPRTSPVRVPFRVGGRRARDPASFRARVIRATLCPASRCANIHRTTGAVTGSGGPTAGCGCAQSRRTRPRSSRAPPPAPQPAPATSPDPANPPSIPARKTRTADRRDPASPPGTA